MTDDEAEKVWKHLEALAENGEAPSGQQLIIDPNTGELVVLEQGTKKPADAIVVDQAAKRGFWLL
jgi:hypothetical protein